MASHFSTIGLTVRSERELAALAEQIGPRAEAAAAAGGSYFRWSDASGAQVWLQVNTADEPIGLNPHFVGSSSLAVGLTARMSSDGPSELDGSFRGWASPAEGVEDGHYPFVFDAPDFRTYDGLELPGVYDVQVAAFAHEIEVFESEAAYYAAQGEGLKYAVRSFIPSGLFAGEDEPPRAEATFTGLVRASERRVNALTGEAFYWAVVDTYGGTYDVVIDATLVTRRPKVGGVVQGSFWLSGRILGPAPKCRG